MTDNTDERKKAFSQLRTTLQRWSDTLTPHPKNRIEVGINSAVFQFGIDNTMQETRLRKLIAKAGIPLPRTHNPGMLRLIDANVSLEKLEQLKNLIEADTATIEKSRQAIAAGLNSLNDAPVAMSAEEMDTFIAAAVHDSALAEEHKTRMGVGTQNPVPRRSFSDLSAPKSGRTPG